MVTTFGHAVLRIKVRHRLMSCLITGTLTRLSLQFEIEVKLSGRALPKKTGCDSLDMPFEYSLLSRILSLIDIRVFK